MSGYREKKKKKQYKKDRAKKQKCIQLIEQNFSLFLLLAIVLYIALP